MALKETEFGEEAWEQVKKHILAPTVFLHELLHMLTLGLRGVAVALHTSAPLGLHFLGGVTHTPGMPGYYLQSHETILWVGAWSAVSRVDSVPL